MAAARISGEVLSHSFTRYLRFEAEIDVSDPTSIEWYAYATRIYATFLSKRTTGEEGPFRGTPEALLPRKISL